MKTDLQIFDFTDYRLFLGEYYARRKASLPSYSHRVFARQAGLSSPSHLLMIIKGERNLSQKTIPKFAEGLDLSPKERRYFEVLVLFNQTDDLQLKAQYFGELIAIKSSLKGLSSLDKEKFQFLSKWYVVAIYVLIDIQDFKADLNWIVKRLGDKVTVYQAKEALETLKKLGMIEEDSARGFRQLSGAITVADDTKSIAVYNYHQAMLKLAAEALRTLRPDQREMNGATISIPKDKLPELKEKIRNFRKEINQLASSYQNPDEIFQLNIQLFPLTSMEEK